MANTPTKNGAPNLADKIPVTRANQIATNRDLIIKAERFPSNPNLQGSKDKMAEISSPQSKSEELDSSSDSNSDFDFYKKSQGVYRKSDYGECSLEEHLVLNQIMMGKFVPSTANLKDDDEEQRIKSVIELQHQQELEEGIFIFRRANQSCQLHLPVNEAVYLANYQQKDQKSFEEEKEEFINAQKTLAETMKLSEHFKRMKTKLEKWEYANKIVVYDAKSLYLFHHETKFRRIIVAIVESKTFENIILTLIILNSLCYTFQDYSESKLLSVRFSRNWWLKYTEQVFSSCFMLECVLKIVSQGFVKHYNSYLSDKWNWIDFMVVIISLLEYCGLGEGNLRAMRAFRVLRPLKSVKALPGMRKLISSLLSSIPSLSYTVFFMSQVFLLFGILAVQEYAGKFYQRCRIGEPTWNAEQNQTVWEYDRTVDRLCSKESDGGMYVCPSHMTCGTPYDRQLSLASDQMQNQELIHYGLTLFDNVVYSFLTIFQMVTLEGWSVLMYNMMDVSQPIMGVFISQSVVVLCAFCLLNVILAVLAESIAEQDLEDKDEIKQKIAISKSISRAIAQKKKGESQANRLSRKSMNKAQATKAKEFIATFNSKPTEPERDQTFGLDQMAKPEFKIQTKPESFSKSQHPGSTLNTGNCLNENQTQTNLFGQTSEILSDDFSNAEYKSHSPMNSDLNSTFDKTVTLGFDKPNHAKKNNCFGFSYEIVAHPMFNLIIVLLIAGNVVVLAMDRVGLTEEQRHFMHIANIGFTIAFTLEMTIKLLGLGIKEYGRDFYNWFDAILVIMSLVEIVVNSTHERHKNSTSAFTAMRGVRLLRIFKLARQWTALRDLLRWLAKTFTDSVNFVILFCLFVCIFMLIGLEFFAFEIGFNEDNDPVKRSQIIADRSLSPRENFNTPQNALVTIFIVAIGDDWTQVMYSFYRVELEQRGRFAAAMTIVFFILMYTLMNVLLLNLFLAILLDSYGRKPTEEEIKEEEEEEADEDIGPVYICLHIMKYRTLILLHGWLPGIFNDPLQETSVGEQQSDHPFTSPKKKEGTSQPAGNQKNLLERMTTLHSEKLGKPLLALRNQRIADREKKELEQATVFSALKNATTRTLADQKITEVQHSIALKKSDFARKLKGDSLCMFSTENRLRKQLHKIVQHDYFDYSILFLIFVSTCLLILSNPLNDPESHYTRNLLILDRIMTGLFIFECVIKVIVDGFACNGPTSYLVSNWNKVDFLIILVAGVGWIPGVKETESHVLKVIRMFRVLRPLRLVNRFPHMRIAVESVFQSVPKFVNLLMIFVLMLLLFSILGTTFFKGKFAACHRQNVGKNFEVKTSWDCYDAGGEWINPSANFDNTLTAMLTLFTAVTSEGWTNLMWNGVDAVGINLEPQRSTNPHLILYFLIFMAICSIIILNLFVGVVIDTNATEKEKLLNTNQLTLLQLEYSDTLTKCYQTYPAIIFKTNNKCKDALQKLASSPRFSDFITLCIVINTILMAFTWFGEPLWLSTVMDGVQYAFTLIYIVEAVILISVQGWFYFKDGWRQFDFLIVVLSILSFILKVFDVSTGKGAALIRSFRILRPVKMVRRVKQLRKIFTTFEIALPNLIQVGSLLLLVQIIYAVLGVYLFAKLKVQETAPSTFTGLSLHANFRDFGTAMLTLVRIATGEAWNDIMWDCMRQRSILFQCEEEEQTYAALQKGGMQGCGGGWSGVYFVTFIIIVVFIMINMFISIILDGYNTSRLEQIMSIRDGTIEIFKEKWMRFDENGTCLIERTQFKWLIIDLVFEELKQFNKLEISGQNEDKDDLNVLFNLRLTKNLVTFAQREAKIDVDTSIHSLIEKRAFLKQQLNKSWQSFEAFLQLPCYKHLEYYNFHDILIALVKNAFISKHRHQFIKRQIRIENALAAGLPLTKWEKMTEGSVAFKKLDIAEQERFLEISEHDFTSVVDRLEAKALRSGSAEIYKLKMMRDHRRKTDAPFIKYLDKVCNNDQMYVVDSSQVVGALIIKKFVARWKARKEKQKMAAQIQESPIQTSLEIADTTLDNASQAILFQEKRVLQKNPLEIDDSTIISKPSQINITQEAGFFFPIEENSTDDEKLNKHQNNQTTELDSNNTPAEHAVDISSESRRQVDNTISIKNETCLISQNHFEKDFQHSPKVCTENPFNEEIPDSQQKQSAMKRRVSYHQNRFYSEDNPYENKTKDILVIGNVRTKSIGQKSIYEPRLSAKKARPSTTPTHGRRAKSVKDSQIQRVYNLQSSLSHKRQRHTMSQSYFKPISYQYIGSAIIATKEGAQLSPQQIKKRKDTRKVTLFRPLFDRQTGHQSWMEGENAKTHLNNETVAHSRLYNQSKVRK